MQILWLFLATRKIGDAAPIHPLVAYNIQVDNEETKPTLYAQTELETVPQATWKPATTVNLMSKCKSGFQFHRLQQKSKTGT